MGIEEKLPSGVLLTTVEGLARDGEQAEHAGDVDHVVARGAEVDERAALVEPRRVRTALGRAGVPRGAQIGDVREDDAVVERHLRRRVLLVGRGGRGDGSVAW